MLLACVFKSDKASRELGEQCSQSYLAEQQQLPAPICGFAWPLFYTLGLAPLQLLLLHSTYCSSP